MHGLCCTLQLNLYFFQLLGNLGGEKLARWVSGMTGLGIVENGDDDDDDGGDDGDDIHLLSFSQHLEIMRGHG